MNIRLYAGSILLGLFCIVASIAHAGIPEGYGWLTSQQQADGSFLTQTDLAITSQSTYATLSLSSLAKSAFLINSTNAQAYLQNQTQTDTEFLSQALLSGVTIANGQLVAPVLSQHQNGDGGFGDQFGYQSTPIDTALALDGLDAAGQLSGAQLTSALYYLVTTQSLDGS